MNTPESPDMAARAHEEAIRLLAHRQRTEAELRLRLRRKGYPPEPVAECIARLHESKLLDDGAFAESFARDRARFRPRGRRRVIQELRSLGVEEEVAAAAVRETLDDDLTLAHEAARRWRERPGEDPARARRRLAAFLARRGFGADIVREAIDDRLGGL